MACVKKASLLQEKGDPAEAIRLYDCAIGIHERLRNSGQHETAPQLASVYMLRGAVVAVRQSNPQGGLPWFDRSIALYTELVQRGGQRQYAEELAKVQKLKGMLEQMAAMQ